MKKSKTLWSFFITVFLYVAFFAFVDSTGGNESDNGYKALGTFVAMTFFINFPICWYIIYAVLKDLKK